MFAAARIADEKRRPPLFLGELLWTLRKAGVPEFVARFRAQFSVS